MLRKGKNLGLDLDPDQRREKVKKRGKGTKTERKRKGRKSQKSQKGSREQSSKRTKMI